MTSRDGSAWVDRGGAGAAKAAVRPCRWVGERALLARVEAVGWSMWSCSSRGYGSVSSVLRG